VLVACWAPALADQKSAQTDAPPTGIKPTGATLQSVLDRHAAAVGVPARAWRSYVKNVAVSAYGETGLSTELRSGSDYKVTQTIGPVTTSFGRSGKIYWRQTPNGYTIRLSDAHAGDELIDRSPDEQLVLPSNHAKLLGEVAAPLPAYVVSLTPDNGRTRWVFIDKQSGLIDRMEYIEAGDRISATFDDFRATNGVTEPWHGHTSMPQKANDVDWKISSIVPNVPVQDGELMVPPDRRTVLEFPAGVTSVDVPVRIVDGAIIVRVRIQGRGVDLQVDSGAGGIFLNRGLVNQLKLPTFGFQTETKPGQYAPSETIVPEIQIGNLRMRNVYAMSLSWYAEPDETTEVEGLIGFDLLAGGFTKLDYLNQLLSISDWRQVTFPAGRSFIVPIALDDEVPTAGAKVGEAVGDRFILDTGDLANIIIFRHFADAHPADVADAGEGRVLHNLIPYIATLGVGGRVDVLPTQVRSFHFGGVGFDDFTLFVAQKSDAFNAADYDGLIGWRFLEFFDVYFDYHNSRVILAPNKFLLRVTKHL